MAVTERRKIVVPGDKETTIVYAVEHFISCAESAISSKGSFKVALSGGSTPKLIYQKLALPEYRDKLQWSKVHLFWSDERSVPPDDKESNYHMAIIEGKLGTLPIPKEQIHRMVAESEIEKNAAAYEALIKEPFDLMMLGVGEDGHTASLFPGTSALFVLDRLATANFVPQKNTWRMTLTYTCINAAKNIAVYMLGIDKKHIAQKILLSPYQPDLYPSQRVGTPLNQALFILDTDAASGLK